MFNNFKYSLKYLLTYKNYFDLDSKEMTEALNDQRKKYEERVKEIQAKMLKVTERFLKS